MTTSLYHVSVSAESQPGLVREHNEDMLLIDTDTYRDAGTCRNFDLDVADTLIIAVADGLGGHNAGEVASADALRELGAHVAALPSVLSSDELHQDLTTWVRTEHEYLIQQGIENPENIGMATTLVATLFYRGRVYLINCGDSRLYLYNAGGLHQLSTDHSLFRITQDPQDRHVITNCIGAGDETYIDFEDITERLTQGCRLLLCSDGLTDMLSDEDIAAALCDSAEAKDLVQSAYEAGARDNVSVIVATITDMAAK